MDRAAPGRDACLEAGPAGRGGALPLRRFRFWGIRGLNWAEKAGFAPDVDHVEASGCAPWLTLSRISVVVGPNGGGKTTVLDVLRALGSPDVWPSLPRENMRGSSFSGMQFEGADWQFRVEFRTSASPHPRAILGERLVMAVGAKGPPGGNLDPSRKMTMPVTRHASAIPAEVAERHARGGWRGEAEAALRRYVPFEVVTVDAATCLHGIAAGEIGAVLAEFSGQLHGVAPLRHGGTVDGRPGSERVGIALCDDDGQYSDLDLDGLPLGWRQLAAITILVRRAKPGSLVVLDEPDRSLHPRLQRFLLERVAARAEEAGLQVVVATHSPALINPALLRQVGGEAFQATRGRCEPLRRHRAVLDDLGVSSSDLLQACGVVWVEGPSDHIYVNHWLKLYAEHAGGARTRWIDGINYAVAHYAGALARYVAWAPPEADAGEFGISDLRAINRNSFLVIDGDRRSAPEGGTARGAAPTGMDLDRARLVREADGICGEGRHRDMLWITEHYAIEDYLPEAFDGDLRRTDGRTGVIPGKVALARRFCRTVARWEDAFRPGTDLPERIAGLHRAIGAWQLADEWPRGAAGDGAAEP